MDIFVFFGRDCLGTMVGVGVVMELGVEVVVGEAVEVVRADFFVFLGRDCFWKMMGASVVMEVVVEKLVVVWWR